MSVSVSDKVKQKYCTSIEECKVKHAEVIKDWTEFFRRIKVASSASDHDATVALMWKAHTTSINHGESRIYTVHAQPICHYA